MHLEPIIMPKFLWALFGVLLLLLGEAFLPSRPKSGSKFLSELCFALGLLIGGWHWGIYQHLDENLQVAIAIFSSWGVVRGGQWSAAGVIKIFEILTGGRFVK